MTPVPPAMTPPAASAAPSATAPAAEGTASSPAAAPQRPRLYRSTSDRYLAGVCGGIAEHLGVSSALVRAVMVIIAVAGPGTLLYGFFWVMTKPDTSAPGGVVTQASPQRRLTRNQTLLVVGAAIAVVGLAWGGPTGNVTSHLGWALPIIAVAAGALLAWSQLDDSTSARPRSRRSRVLSIARPVVGVVLAAAGVVALATQGQGYDVVLTSGLAAVAVLVGAAVIAAPWVVRMWQGLQAEQTERIRVTERADIAAHLHDSVLQTLALIQRRADDPQTVVRLARSQERELRDWLYAGQQRSADSLASAVTSAAHEVEDDHGVAIELVVSGDRHLDPGGEALVKAAREAMLNAVRHGQPPVSVYVEVGPTGVEAFVRDHGPGFDLEQIAHDRHGVRESILRRMERHGGKAKIRALDIGTEVELTLPPLRSESGEAPGAGTATPAEPAVAAEPPTTAAPAVNAEPAPQPAPQPAAAREGTR